MANISTMDEPLLLYISIFDTLNSGSRPKTQNFVACVQTHRIWMSFDHETERGSLGLWVSGQTGGSGDGRT